MNLILNRDTFQMPADGWYQLAPLGEFAHAAAGVVQVVDGEACAAMAARFEADAAVANFAGLLVDFDHFSLSGENRSEAAGWIVALEARAEGTEGQRTKGTEGSAEGTEFEQKAAKGTKAGGAPDGRALPQSGTGPAVERGAHCGAGLWAQIRWSDVGEAAVKGGRYRFLSPVWTRVDCVDLGVDPESGWKRVRPVRLLNAAVTNDPNLKGLCPLSNSGRGTEAQRIKGTEKEFEQKIAKDAEGGSGIPVDSCASVRGAKDQRGKGTEGGSEQKIAKNAKGGNGIPVDSCASNRGCVEQPGFVPATGTTPRRSAEGGSEGKTMKKVIEKLTNHLGLPGDATEEAILEKMQGLPGVTAVADLQNSLKQAQDERDSLRKELKGAEDEIVNRHLAEFEGVISDGSKAFWTEQLMKNRDGALAALGDLARAKGEGGNLKPERGDGSQTRKPLHNRATARPVIPGQGGASEGTDSKAVKIRNRAHEIAKGEKIPFSVAFRRAEKEVLEG